MTFVFMVDDVNDVRAELRIVRPEYDLDEYVLNGHTSIFKVLTLFTILAMTLPIGPTLVIIFIIRKMVLAKLAKHAGMMSGRTAKMHNTLTKVLTLQSALPIFFSGAVGSYALCQFDIVLRRYWEYECECLQCVSFMALLAPMITLYCMKPYNNFVKCIVRCNLTQLRADVIRSLFRKMYFPWSFPGHDLATIIHHSIVDSLALIFNILLLLAVVYRSPMSLRSYKVLLINSAIIDLLSSITMLMVMVRIIPASNSLFYIYDGPCVYVSGMFCHCLYTVALVTLSQSLFLIACSFGYRMYILGRPSPSSKAVFAACLLVSIPNLIMLKPIYDRNQFMTFRQRSCSHSTTLQTFYKHSLGHVSIFIVLTLFTILAMTMPIGPTIVLIFFMRKKVLTKLTAHSVQMSGRTAQMHSTLTKVLTLQSVLPVFFRGAVASYALCQFDVVCSPVQEHFIMECVSFMALLSPMITLYCMKPYKEFVLSIARCDFTEIKRIVKLPYQTTYYNSPGHN
ncbi:hypothetical protein PRIPAC_79632 [Pristionchus pacificus]|uniref:Srd-17 n=1 Tax=Pristionchus pacificus TaxID=54126 RepID=A0A2A6CM70_PRIPA|nr:hypothetical protein PRIPAC_79632 [Pristionchus pacificus]|eukprot:PDM79304.1 srd-17 [Pristionchus pacificus]